MKIRASHILFVLGMSSMSSAVLAENECRLALDDDKDQVSFEACKVQAEGGNRSAQFEYAQILMFGTGREHHAEEALAWYRRSARQGHLLAQVILGRILSDQKSGVALDEPEAYAWWSVSKQAEAAAQLWSRLSKEQQLKAKSLADEYIANYSSRKRSQSAAPMSKPGL